MKKIKDYKIIFVLTALFIVGFLVFAYDNIIKRPFPFVTMSYTYKQNVFNSSPELLKDRFNIYTMTEFNKTLKVKIISLIKNYKLSNDDSLMNSIKVSVVVSRKIISYSKDSKIRELQDIVDINSKYKNICSETAKIFVTLMNALGYNARVIWMNGHTIASVYKYNESLRSRGGGKVDNGRPLRKYYV